VEPVAPVAPLDGLSPPQPQSDRPANPQNGNAEPDGEGPEAEAPRAATLTGVLGAGAVADRGSILYAADTEPVVALLAPEALFRDLDTGSPDGDDIKALEENLSALGYGSGVTVDRHFDGGTAAAVKRWERALGRETPDGIVSVGEVVLLPEPAAVISLRAAVGDKLKVGTPVLTLGTESRVVTARLDVEDRASWALNTVVQIDWAGGPGTGTVTEVGRDEVDGQVEVTIALGPGAPDVPIGTEVDVSTVTAERKGVVTVPVSAIVRGRSGPAVRTGGSELPVKLGIVSGGLIEITGGVEAGAQVLLPGG
jgi:peptidoglycan hydrolase-like protein with peptidoglycan-binding domain